MPRCPIEATTIDDVIDLMGQIIEQSRRDNLPSGYFTALYRLTTVAVKAKLDEDFFENSARMAHLDVIFANRYFDAYDLYRQGKQPTACWGVAFKAGTSRSPLIMQHLLVGMNAHISYDLGICVARLEEGPLDPALKRDFVRTNAILATLVDRVQTMVATLSPLFGLLDRLGAGSDEAIVNFSMTVARDASWRMAEGLVPLALADQEMQLVERDKGVADFGRRLLRPRGWIGLLVWLISLTEKKDPNVVLAVLAALEDEAANLQIAPSLLP